MTADTKPQAVDLTHHLSTIAKSRRPSPLKEIIQYMRLDNMISLAGGLPTPDFFPLHNIHASFYPSSTVLDPEHPQPPSESMDITINRLAKGKDAIDLSKGLQYTGGRGLIAFEKHCRDLTERLFPPAYADWDVLVNSGSTDGWTKLLTMLVNSGDYVICDDQVYPTAQATFIPLGVKAHPVVGDSEGMLPEELDKSLANWDESKGPRPRVLYCVPVGQNPLGTTMGMKRRQALYDICVKYDIILVEDDPYCMLQFEPYVLGAKSEPPAEKADVEGFINSMSKSFLTLDTQGRVIRMDTFSKTLVPGGRIGWFTCNEMFSERLLRATEVATQGASGFSQVIMGELLNQWGTEGFLEWCTNLRDQYRVRRDWMLDALAESFDLVPAEEAGVEGALGLVAYAKGQAKTGPPIMSFVPPVGGMFIWCTTYYKTHPAYAAFAKEKASDMEAVRDFEEIFWLKLVQARVLITPGWYYTPFEGDGVHSIHEEGSGHFRLAFSFEPKDRIDEGIHRLAECMTKEWTSSA